MGQRRREFQHHVLTPSFCHVIGSQMEKASVSQEGREYTLMGPTMFHLLLREDPSELIEACWNVGRCHLTAMWMRRVRHG